MGNCYSLYSKNLGMSGKMVWWSTEPNWSTKLGDLTGCLILTLGERYTKLEIQCSQMIFLENPDFKAKKSRKSRAKKHPKKSQ